MPAVAFHAGLEPAHKREALTRFRSGEPVVVVATIAFGMGIDRPDVRFVVHLDMPDSPGGLVPADRPRRPRRRAGRDAAAVWRPGHRPGARIGWRSRRAPDAQKHVMRTKLEEMIALTEAASCRTRSLLGCFGEALPEPCGHCDNCLRRRVMVDATVEAQKVLSAVYRTGQMFGALHIVAVLRGETTDGVLRHGHDRLPTFGIGCRSRSRRTGAG